MSFLGIKIFGSTKKYFFGLARNGDVYYASYISTESIPWLILTSSGWKRITLAENPDKAIDNRKGLRDKPLLVGDQDEHQQRIELLKTFTTVKEGLSDSAFLSRIAKNTPGLPGSSGTTRSFNKEDLFKEVLVDDPLGRGPLKLIE